MSAELLVEVATGLTLLLGIGGILIVTVIICALWFSDPDLDVDRRGDE